MYGHSRAAHLTITTLCNAFYDATSSSIAGAQKELIIITANSGDTVTKTLGRSVTNQWQSHCNVYRVLQFAVSIARAEVYVEATNE